MLASAEFSGSEYTALKSVTAKVTAVSSVPGLAIAPSTGASLTEMNESTSDPVAVALPSDTVTVSVRSAVLLAAPK